MDTSKNNTRGEEKSEKKFIIFECFNCKMHENVDFKGTKPPFAKEITLKEDSYVMKDPFSDPGQGQILVVGNDCCFCNKMVCLGKDCSIFYTKTFCIGCAGKNLESLPSAIKSKLPK